ncbi:phage tail tape measure protein [Rhizobium laguerreae]|uniref:phage tail tape measure protein n=1 Tax=Rhizobium laguerreae TaxID=1076926 RepID=UPI001C91AB8E|nr:phage tail tape measure protein [Rhizobium laguerreae]MBY3434815.1 phage tail tape measure protein [Rhizobium laguerreae]MBY3448958.1 phage tail tape measure protein [Rhizobium laguerreae]MBY3456732.1 phage tail tape measure protein [Rhizobium laguerreae]
MAILQSTLRLSLVDQVTGRARAINGALNGIRTSQSALLGTFGRIAALGGAYLGVTQGIAGTAGAAMDFESAFADVRKVVDATDEQFENMRRTIRQMSNELPIAATDIAAMFAAAGESGVATTDLKAFSEMAARVGIAFDLSAGQAGESLAKLKTQLGLTVPETGDLADAINHLSNNMASKAKDVTDYMLRVGALAEMGGFAKEEIAAIGSSMIAAGAQSETAGTAMQNVVKALTRGEFAKKDQREAAEALGLDLPSIAKQMQKDAPKALKKVLTAISKAPKHQHISLLSQFFGDEAKAFAPLVGNIGLLDQALDSVSDKSKYAGSAFREYVERSNTTANVLQVLRNRFVNLGSSIGDGMLPYIKAAALEIGEIFDTLGERVTVFDRIGTAIQGFANGLGGGGAFRQLIDDVKEFLFGVADGSSAADELGRIFMKFKEWGASVRELTTAVANNPIVKFFADLAPYGMQIMLWSTGLMVLAGTIRKLASAMMLLSGVSTIMGALKTVGAIAAVVGGGAAGTSSVAAAGAGAGAATVGSKLLGLSRLLIAGAAIGGAVTVIKESYTGDTSYARGQSLMPSPTDLAHAIGSAIANAPSLPAVPGVYAQMALDNANRARAAGIGGNTTDTLPGKTADDLRIDASSIAAMTQPSGVQQVLVTNPQAPNVTVHAPITITGVSDPQAAAASAAAQMGTAVKSAVEGGHMDYSQ